MIRWLKRAALGAAAVLSACGEDTGTLTLQEVRPAFSKDWLIAVALNEGLPVEIHGAPFPGVSAAQAAQNLRFPNSYPNGLGFRLIAPDADSRATDNRMKLFFNLASPPDAVELCRESSRARVNAPVAGQFDAYVMFCTRERFIAAAQLDIRNIEPGDWARYARAFQGLFLDLAGIGGGAR